MSKNKHTLKSYRSKTNLAYGFSIFFIFAFSAMLIQNVGIVLGWIEPDLTVESTSTPTELIFSSIIAIISLFFLLKFAKKRRKILKKFEPYFIYFRGKKRVNLEDLSYKLNLSIDEVEGDLSEMMRLNLTPGYLMNNYFILVPDASSDSDFTQESSHYPQGLTVVKCKECGAKNTIQLGMRTECEYCGTVLQ